jgi:predicted ATPase/DNA-binding CsgD family transcriptional regulator
MAAANVAGAQGHDSPRPVPHTKLQVLPNDIRLASTESDIHEQATRLLGRVRELEVLRSLLLEEGVRLLTLVGPAGVGKTRLAMEVGSEVGRNFSDGTVFVDLASVRNPATFLVAIGEALGCQNLDAPTLLEWLQAYLAERELLLILDNVEQLVPSAPMLADLVAAAPRLTMLATSREPLHLRFEQVFPVPPLTLPNFPHLPPMEELARIPSLALFLQRARAIDPDYSLNEDDAHAVAELVVHLDGLPLAIELAAARTRLLSPRMILERLDRRLSLLRWPAQDLPWRQQTLRSAIAWSYDLLSSDDQALFRHLGIFVGSFSLADAEAIAESLEVDAIEGLGSLVDKSMVQVQGRDLDRVRYGLLESMREYALERLGDAGELEGVGRTHALYYVALAEQAEPELTGREQQIWFGRLESAHDNLRAALHWLLDHEEGDLAVRLATALGYFWEARGYIAEGQRWLDTALRKAPAVDPGLRARALSRLGILLTWTESDVTRPRAVLTEARDLARSVQDVVTIARSLLYLGVLGVFTKEWSQSRQHLEEARTYWEEAGDSWGVAYTCLYLGAVEVLQGRREEATRLLEESLTRYRDMGDVSARGVVLLWLIYAAGGQGDVVGALPHWREMLGLSVETRDLRLMYLCGVGVTWVLREQGDPEQLARLFGVIQQLREMMGIHRGRILYTSEVLSIAVETLQARLEPSAFEAALAEGRHAAFGEMARLVGELLDGIGQASASGDASPERGPTILSPREQAVLHLVGEGLSNKQIAKELIVSPSTVKSHVTGIFNKLGVDSRAHAVAVAAQRDLLQIAATQCRSAIGSRSA